MALPLVRHILLWKMESLLAGEIYDNAQAWYVSVMLNGEVMSVFTDVFITSIDRQICLSINEMPVCAYSLF